MRHFLSLATGMSEEMKASLRKNGQKLHIKVPKFFHPEGGTIRRTDKLVKYIQDYVSFSFVRHPFER